MKAVQQTLQAVRAALKDDAVLPSTEKAAEDYARFCEQAQQRLDTVALMLQKGSEYQALQAAEEEPSLLEFVGLLSFGDEKAWQTFCETHDLTPAPKLNARTVRDLEALYAKGVSANHPLYKDFRAAVLSRDDARSLKIVQTILKLNPGDENARKELQRLENKRLQETVEELRAALKTDDEERIATLAEAIRATTPDAKLERLDVYEQGEAVRRALRKRQTRARIPGLMAELEALQAAGNWKGTGALLETVQALRQEHGADLVDRAGAARLEALAQYYQREKAADDKRRQFERTLKGFIAFVEEVETRLLTGSGVSYDEVAEKDEAFVRRWKELEAFQLPVPNDVLQRLKAAGQELRAKLDRMHAARRVKNLALAAVAVALLVAVAAVGLHAWKAHSLAQDLAAYRAKEQAVPAEELIRKLRAEEELLLRWPYLQSRVAEVDAWAAQARVTEKQAREALQALEDSFADKKKSLAPAQLVKQMADAKALVGQVAADLAPELKNRLAALQTRGDLQFDGSRKKLKGSTATTLAEMEPEAEKKLSYERPVAESAESWKDLDKRLAALEALLKPETEELKLPADIETRIKALRQKLTAFHDALEKFKKARAVTAEASTLEAYKTALAGWQDLRFVEAAPAMKMLDSFPNEKAFQAALLTSGDQELLQAVVDDVSGRHMAPDVPLDTDRQILLNLMGDTNLNDVWESTLISYGPQKATTTLWSQGQPRSALLGDSTRWSGVFYDPQASERSVLFIKRDFVRVGSAGSHQGQAILSSRLSATSDFMSRLQVKRMTDENGDRFLRPLLEVFDTLVKDQAASPLAKAYVMLRLERMASLRPQAWGLHLCPSLQADLRKLNSIVGSSGLRSEDWMVPALREQWTAPLTEFFQGCATRSYFKEASIRREFLRTAAAAGVKYGGYVETDGTVVPTQAGRAAAELWVLSRDTGKPLLVPNPAVAAAQPAGKEAPKLKAPGAAPLSPAFFLPLDRRQLLQRHAEASSAPGAAAKPQTGDALLLTIPTP